MKSLAAILALATLMTACATVISNDGETVVIDWDDSLQSKKDAEAVALKSCNEVGKKSARLVANVSVNPSMPNIYKRRLSFRCE